MKRFYFGYDECALVFWDDAHGLPELFQNLEERGMEKPDWIDPVAGRPDALPRSH
jgi:hypothetical protein